MLAVGWEKASLAFCCLILGYGRIIWEGVWS